MPAIVDRSPLMIAVASGGGAPMLARRVREQLEALLDQSWGRMAQFLSAWRLRIRTRFDTSRERRAFYRELLEGPIMALVRRGREADAAQALGERLAAPADHSAPGSVILVGAGPGTRDF
jgi:uroporphyrin-III C-methyltransferase/precorrin-2 dehydrogenase/sirohydrochlorin ferrochelatase